MSEAQVFKQDCRQGIPRRVRNGSVNLAFADPPYNIGQDYADYHDKKSHDEYMAFSREWMSKVKDALHKHGAFWLAINDDWVSELDMVARNELKLYRRSWVTWYYTFGQANKRNFARCKTNLLYFVKTKSKHTFNMDDPKVRVPSARQLKYKDKRANNKGKLPDDVWMVIPEQCPKDAFDATHDVWLYSRVCGTFKAKHNDSPNQMPVQMLDRIVRLCSNAGDLVMDPFVGTGTTGHAAVKGSRRFIGFDISPACIRTTRKRMKEAKVEADIEADQARTLFDGI